MPKFESTLHFSNWFTSIQLFLILGSLICVAYLPLAAFIKIGLFLSVLCYGSWNVYSHSQWKLIGRDTEGWYLEKKGEKYYVIFSGDSTVTSLVSILRFKLKNQFFKQSCIIFKDAMPSDLYRSLIVKIRYS